MEWVLPVNEMLIDNISKLNCSLIPPGFHGDVRSMRIMMESLCKVIDTIGTQSAKAQGLNKVITTAEKLRNSPTHILYLLKDAKAKQGKGELIGLLKIGRKHLFLFDDKDKVREVEPLCVLDFFIVPDRQRHGYGRILFDYMLEDMETAAHELAIDGPSPKMERFLNKNYRIERLIRQSNNFAISSTFFDAIEAANKADQETPVVTAAVGRFAAPKPVSAIAHVIHGAHFEDPNHGAAEDNSVADAEVDKAVVPRPKTDEAREINDGSIGIEEVADNQKSPERPSTLKVEPVSSCNPALLGSCNPALLGSCNPALLGSCNPALLGSCNPAVLGSGKPAMLGSGNPAMLGSGKPAMLGSGNPAMIGSGNPAMLGSGNPAMLGSGKPAMLGSGNPAMIGSGNPAMLGSGKPAMLGSGNPAMLGSGNPAMLGSGNPAMIGSGNPAMLGSGKPAMLGSGNPAMLGSGSPAMLGSGSPAQSPAGSTACRRDSQLTDRGYFDVKFYHNKLW